MSRGLIAHVINSTGVGGAEILLSDTVKLLPDFEHVVVTLRGSQEGTPDLHPFLKGFYCLNVKGTRDWPGAIYKLRKILKMYTPLLVHVHLQEAGIITKTACPKNTPLFYSLHNPYSIDAFRPNRLALPLEKLTARRYHHLIGVSDFVLKDYQKYVPNAGTGDVVYNAVRETFFNTEVSRYYNPKTPLRCISVGKLKRQKNYLHTLLAFNQLKDYPITLDIYGNGPEEESLKTFAAINDLKNIRFMGVASNVDQLLSEYDLYLISSSYEGFGIAPLEAMTTGLPVLASDIPVFREVAGNTIHYFDLNQEESLVDKLKGIFSGELVLEEKARAAKKRARALSHPTAYRQNLIAVYQKYVSC